MKQKTVEAAYDYATEKTKFRKDVLKEVDVDSYLSRHSDCMEDFQCGYNYCKEQSTWISVKDELPPLNKEVIVYNGAQIYMSHRTDNDCAKDANSFLYGLQTFDVIAWMQKPKFNE